MFEGENLYIFWTIWGISLKFSGKTSLMIISRVQKAGFHSLSRKHIFEKPTEGHQITPPPPDFLGSGTCGDSQYNIENNIPQSTLEIDYVIKNQWRHKLSSVCITMLGKLIVNASGKRNVDPTYWIRTTVPRLLKFIVDKYKVPEVCERAVGHWTLSFVPDQYKTQQLFERAIVCSSEYVPDECKTKEL